MWPLYKSLGDTIMKEGKIVYCVDKKNPLYGKRFKIEFTAETGKMHFSEMQTGKLVDLKEEQVSEYPPPTASYK